MASTIRGQYFDDGFNFATPGGQQRWNAVQDIILMLCDEIDALKEQIRELH